MEATSRRWNHNIHYHPLILDAVPADARSGLDVGCGNGLLSTDMRRVIPDVIGIDVDHTVIEENRQQSDSVTWVLGDVMTYNFGRRFDVVASVATLHHFSDLEVALSRLADLTAPGGVLAIVGLARATRPKDALLHLGGAVQHQWLARKYEYWEHTAPTVWPPPHDYVTVRRTAERVLPGVSWKHMMLWRYSLVWHKPIS